MNLEDIYRDHKKMVYNLALQYTQNIEDAEEVAQDVFVSIYNSIDKFQANSKLSTWIYRITINKSLDFIKAKKTKKRFAFITNLFFEDSNEVKHDKANFNHPGVELENKEAVEKIFHVMNLSIKAAESLYQRAKQNLSKKLNN